MVSKKDKVNPDIMGLTASLIVWGIRQFKGKGVQEVIDGVRLQNKVGLKPMLIKEHPTESGKDYIFALPAGVDKTDFEKNRHYFESYTNSIVEIEAAGRKLIVKTFEEDFPDMIKFKFDPSSYPDMIAPFPIGKTPDGKLIVEDLPKLPHLMVGGETNFGKTSFVMGAMTSFLLSGSKVFVVDRKGLDFPRFHHWVNLALNDQETEELLRNLVMEMHSRIKLLSKADCQNYLQYREKGYDLPYLVLIVDELTQIKNKKCFEYINDLAVLSRAAGISLVLATQKPSAKLWDGFSDVRSQLAGAMCFYVRDQTDSQVVLGSGNTRGAELPKIKGRAIWNNDRDQMVQAMYLDAETAYNVLCQHVKKGVYEFEHHDKCTEGIET